MHEFFLNQEAMTLNCLDSDCFITFACKSRMTNSLRCQISFILVMSNVFLHQQVLSFHTHATCRANTIDICLTFDVLLSGIARLKILVDCSYRGCYIYSTTMASPQDCIGPVQISFTKSLVAARALHDAVAYQRACKHVLVA